MYREKDNSRFLYFCTISVNLFSIAVGTAFAWSSPNLPRLNGVIEPAENPLGEPIGQNQASLIASLLGIGGIFSPIPGGFYSDKFGRKKTLLYSALPIYISFCIIVFAKEIWLFYLARTLAGISAGFLFVTLPNYVAEISEKENRGSLGCIFIASITTGNLIMYAIGAYLPIPFSSAICLIPLTLFFILTVLYVPESPYYLISNGKEGAAEKALMALRGKDRAEIQSEFYEIKDNLKEITKVGILDIFKFKPLLKGICLTSCLIAFQQLSGINSILFYLQDIFELSGSSLPSEISSIIIAVVQVSGSCISAVVADKLGRKFLFYISGFGDTVALICMGFFFYLKDHGENTENISWLPIASLILFIACYTVGFAPVPFMVLSEIFPSNYKAVASMLSVCLCFLGTFITTVFFPSLQDAIGTAQSFWLYSIFCIFSLFFNYFILPETKGKSFAEIQKMMNN